MSNGQRDQPSATPAERGCAILRDDKMPNSETIETIPMVTGADGVIRVSGTRVTLDSILLAFNARRNPGRKPPNRPLPFRLPPFPPCTAPPPPPPGKRKDPFPGLPRPPKNRRKKN